MKPVLSTRVALSSSQEGSTIALSVESLSTLRPEGGGSYCGGDGGGWYEMITEKV